MEGSLPTTEGLDLYSPFQPKPFCQSMILCHVNYLRPWFCRQDYYRIPYFLLWHEVYVDIKNGWTITMVSVSICIITSLFPEPLPEISFSENFTGQTQFEVKLLLLNVYPFWRGSTTAWDLSYRAWNCFSAVSYLPATQSLCLCFLRT